MQTPEAFILIGGKSSRMGIDKALLEIGGSNFVERITCELRKAGLNEISLIGNTNSEDIYKAAAMIGLKLLNDVNPVIHNEKETRASIIGLYSALAHSKSDWIFVIACDLPLIDSNFIRSLEAGIDADAEAVIPIQPDGRYQPFCAFYKRDSALRAAEDTLKSGNWKMTNLLERLNAKHIKLSPESSAFLFNVNTPEDLEAANKLASEIPA